MITRVFAGCLDFDPANDAIETPHGDNFKFSPPPVVTLPKQGYKAADDVYTHPPADRSSVAVDIDADSQRIQRLQPFRPWDRDDFKDLPILLKVKGKCTTHHITPAGPWFRFRGHLENISNNTLIGAVNAHTDKVNETSKVFTGST